ncbi:MAG: DUF1656 domain-containing protein [Nevskia sp.]|nr:DUF1656 domain-containing protein [Nevskia sp.]
MPREIDLLGFYMPTLLPLFIVAFALQWRIDGWLGRLGFYTHVWHPALFRFSVLLGLFAGCGLLLYR